MTDSKDPHHNFDLMKLLAKDQAKRHNCNYSVIIKNPNRAGEYAVGAGSTYEMVADSYFDKPRPNVVKVYETRSEPAEKELGIEDFAFDSRAYQLYLDGKHPKYPNHKRG